MTFEYFNRPRENPIAVVVLCDRGRYASYVVTNKGAYSEFLVNYYKASRKAVREKIYPQLRARLSLQEVRRLMK
jgi:hypothetical protein